MGRMIRVDRTVGFAPTVNTLRPETLDLAGRAPFDIPPPWIQVATGLGGPVGNSPTNQRALVTSPTRFLLISRPGARQVGSALRQSNRRPNTSRTPRLPPAAV